MSRLVNKQFKFGTSGVLCDLWIAELPKVEYQMEPLFMYSGHSIAEFLGYKCPRNALSTHIKPQWRKNWEEIERVLIKSLAPTELPPHWHPHTVFITEAGVYALIMRSKLPAAEEFQRWLFEDVLPELRRTGKYDVRANVDSSKSLELANKYITLQQEVLPLRYKVDLYKTELARYDEKFAEHQKRSTEERQRYENQLLRYDEKFAEQQKRYEEKLIERETFIESKFNTKLCDVKLNYGRQIEEYKGVIMKNELAMAGMRVQANTALSQFGLSTLLARDNIEQNERMRASMAAVKDRVVPSMSERPEKEEYVTCYDRTVDGKMLIRVSRTQRGEIDSCDKKAARYRADPLKNDITSKRYVWLKNSEKFLEMKCANPVTVWLKIRNNYPHLFYGLRYVNKLKTEMAILDEAELRAKYRRDVSMCESRKCRYRNSIAEFEALKLIDEEDAVMKCLLPSAQVRERMRQIIETVIRDVQSELNTEEPLRTYDNASDHYSSDEILKCINMYGHNNYVNVVNFFADGSRIQCSANASSSVLHQPLPLPSTSSSTTE